MALNHKIALGNNFCNIKKLKLGVYSERGKAASWRKILKLFFTVVFIDNFFFEKIFS